MCANISISNNASPNPFNFGVIAEGPPVDFIGDFLLVGGGGGGCSYGDSGMTGGAGGGGAAGDVVQSIGTLVLDPEEIYLVEVGVGGSFVVNGTPFNGTNSRVVGGDIDLVAVRGDGGISAISGQPVSKLGGDNENWEGGVGDFLSAGGGAGSSGNGYDYSPTPAEDGGDGGDGTIPNIIWAPVNVGPNSPLSEPLAAGGGGATSGSGNPGISSDGGGTGASAVEASSDPTTFGSGGSGGSDQYQNATSGHNGVVVIRYAAPQIFTGGDNIEEIDGYIYHRFLSGGSLTPI